MITIYQYSHNEYEMLRGEQVLKNFYQAHGFKITVKKLFKLIDIIDSSHEIDYLYAYEDVWLESIRLISHYSEVKNQKKLIILQVNGSLDQVFLASIKNYILPKEPQFNFQGKHHPIQLKKSEIQYLEKVNRKVYLKTATSKYEMLDNYQEIARKLAEHNFLSPYVNILVNPQVIKKVKGRIITLSSGEELPLSQKKAAAFRKQLKESLNSVKKFSTL